MENRYGRKGGRGLRPWLLIPKVLAVGVYLGSVTTCAVIFFTRDAERVAETVEQVSRLMRFLVVPAMLTAATFGVLLLMQHPRVFLRMRWFQAKLAIMAAGVPAAHFFMSSRLDAMRHAVDSADAARELTWGFAVLLAGSAVVVFIGRHKPRLGQNWAKAYRAAVLAMALFFVGGCHWSNPVRETERTGLPNDFALEFVVKGDAGSRDPMERSSVFILEADRRLRVAEGPMVAQGLYPRRVRPLTHEQFAAIVAHVNERNLMAEPTSPAGELAQRGRLNPRVMYHVDVSMDGRINRYVTTPEESPPTVALHTLLRVASGEDE